MIDFPNAKINLGLQIIEKRSDGYHTIASVFYPVSWCDALEIVPSQKFEFTVTGAKIPEDGHENLCVRAYELLQKDFDLSPVHIHLHKTLPTGAGLGGGSADAAFVIKMLNTQFKIGLESKEMEAYARKLGSDCAFFIENRPRLALAKGDIFKEISVDLSGYWIALVFPQLHISSKQAYAGVKPQKPLNNLKDIISKNPKEWQGLLVNDFEESLFPQFPVLGEIKEKLKTLGSVYYSMTGSGSAVFGLFENEPPNLQSHFQAEYITWLGRLS
jgi:4-diphosphocytidyl-2-C-methyl-D-erythritol kinase